MYQIAKHSWNDFSKDQQMFTCIHLAVYSFFFIYKLQTSSKGKKSQFLALVCPLTFAFCLLCVLLDFLDMNNFIRPLMHTNKI